MSQFPTRPLIVAAVVLVLGAVGVFALRPRSPVPSAPQQAGDVSALLDGQQLGVTRDLEAVLASAQTRVVDASGSHAHVVQVMDGVRQEVFVRADPVEVHLSRMTVPLRTAHGDPFYPAKLEFSEVPGGYQTDVAFFIREDDLPPDVLATLKAQRLARDEPPSVILAAFRAPQYPGVPGILVQAATTSTSGSGFDIDNGKTSIRPAEAAPGPESGALDDAVNGKTAAPTKLDPVESSKAREQATKKFEELVKQLKKEGRHIDNILDEGDRKVTLERNGKKWSKLGTRAVQGLSILEMLRAAHQLYQGLEGLDSLRDCLHNPVAPTAKRALKEDPALKRTEDRLNEAGTDLKVITSARVLNGAAHFLAGEALKGNPAQFLMMALAMASEGMLSDTQETVLSDVASGVVPCETRWVSAELAATMTEAVDKESFSSNVTEILHARIVFGVEADGSIHETGGWGDYRWGHSGTDYCAKWSHSIEGLAATYLTGDPSGFKEVDVNGKKERVGLYDLSVNADEHGLEMKKAPGMGELQRTLSGYTCKPVAGSSTRDGSASTNCSFTEVTPMVGGVFYSTGEESGSPEPGRTVHRSCRLILKPLAVKPPVDPTNPPPPPRR